MKHNTLLLVAIIAVALMLSTASAKVNENKIPDELQHFLDVNDIDWNTSEYPAGTLSSVLARDLMIDAYNGEPQIRLGMCKFYNPYAKVGYYFLYYDYAGNGNEDMNGNAYGNIVYIDPETDKIYSFNEAKNRLSSGIVIPYVRYYRWYPYENYEGTGEWPYAE